MTLTSRHSWDFVDSNDSPSAASSFGCASPPESSVCREAKKRLSERWVLMASKQSSLEQRHFPKSSSTLGEMLALSDRKEPATLEENGDNSRYQESVEPISSLTNSVLEPDIAKRAEHTKRDPGKSSCKWRVSNLFFSRRRKSSKDKGHQLKDNSLSHAVETVCSSEYYPEKMDSSITDVPAEHLSEANEQPSPISVLDQSCLEDEKTIPEGCGKQVTSQTFKVKSD
ncbi:hypothetical protein SAY87_026436 [Trapa incisa]|uniref:Uncharacterized protein n=1 Tax=Trapa incisa TaxID=236973 RepID=A0AAN7JLF8_9MYRT|nr:hypothetical protein SAY87_026436 [Trapa incisa]